MFEEENRELTFEFDMELGSAFIVLEHYEVTCELTEKQFLRLKQSYRKGYFKYINEDESIADIFDTVYVEAYDKAKKNYWYPYREGIAVNNFKYPKELMEIDITML